MNTTENTKNTEIAAPIQVTADYSLFHHLPGNRDIKPAHVRELMAAFTEFSHLRQAKPILLNEKYEMVDGQHSYTASRNLGLPVFYQVIPGLTIEHARLLNIMQRSWTLLDFARSYAESGRPAYTLMLQLHEEYPLSISRLAGFMTGGGGGHNTEKIKLGIIELRPMAEIRADLEKLEDFSNYNPAWTKDAFVVTVHRLLKLEDYDHDYMMKRLAVHGKLTVHTTAYDYLRDLEAIYNEKRMTKVMFV